MRDFISNIGIMAAVITDFKGSDTVITDDGDHVVVGSAWIGQQMPKVGDLIYVGNQAHYLMRAAEANEKYDMSPPGEINEPEHKVKRKSKVKAEI